MTLDFQSVACPASPDHEHALADATFTLPASGLLLLRVDSPGDTHPLADLACGLLAPVSGTVTFLDNDWQHTPPAAAAELRGRIGRVFPAGGWLSNLDVDENVTLAQRHHTPRAETEILDAARALARQFDLPELPTGRPNTVPRAILRRAQWVRAFLGSPRLLLLEHPTHETAPSHRTAFVAAVSAARAAGTAVLWITADPADAAAPALNPTLNFELKETKMQPVRTG